MQPSLTSSLEQLTTHFSSDPRCQAMFLWGSMGAGTSDAYSDVDVAVIISDEAFETVKAEIRDLFRSIFGNIVAWIAEGETAESVNYAFLFPVDSHLLLYDFSLATQSWFTRRGLLPREKLLFNKNGPPPPAASPTSILPEETVVEAAPAIKPEDLLAAIQNYWVYMYLNGKYARRNDIFKLLYDQQELFQRHLGLVKFIYPETRWYGWWAKDISLVPEPRRSDLLIYFGEFPGRSLYKRLEREMTLFGRDARQAVAIFDLPYPEETELSVRQHIRRMVAGKKVRSGDTV